MAHAKMDDVDIKAINLVTGKIIRFFVARNITIFYLIKKIGDKFKLSPNTFTTSYQDHEGERVALETDDDLTCAFNRREQHSARQQSSGDVNPHFKQVYFLRVFVEPRGALLPLIKQEHGLNSHSATVYAGINTNQQHHLPSNLNQKLQQIPSSSTHIQGPQLDEQTLNMYISSLGFQG